MQVKNVECQLAEMQIGRFVSGESLSPEAIRQLDEHLVSCESCTQVLNDRKHALQSMLQQGFAAVTTDLPTEDKENLLIKALVEKAATASNPRRMSVEASPERAAANTYGFWSQQGRDPKTISIRKALIYSGILGIVLFAMGYISRGQDSMFGGSAEHAFPAAPVTPQQPEAMKPVAQPPAPESASQKLPAKQDLEPATSATALGNSTVEPITDHSVKNGQAQSNKMGPDQNTSSDASEPLKAPAKAEVHHPRKYVPAAHKRPTRSRRQSKRQPKARLWTPQTSHTDSGIRIYDSAGKPISS